MRPTAAAISPAICFLVPAQCLALKDFEDEILLADTADAVDVQLMENYYASLKSGGTNKLPYTKEYNRLGDFYYYYSSTDNVWSVDQNSSQANANYAASSYPYNRVSIGYETLDSIAASQDIKQIDNYLALVKRQNPGNADSLIKSSINSKPVIYYRDKNATYTADYGKYMFGCQVIWLTNDIKGKNALIVDDLIDTAGSIIDTVSIIRDMGVKSVFVIATHGVFSGPAVKRMVDALDTGAITQLYVTDTIPQNRLLKS